MTGSKGPQVDNESWAAAARPEPLYIRHTHYQESYKGTPQIIFSFVSIIGGVTAVISVEDLSKLEPT